MPTWTRPEDAPHPGGDHLPACWVQEWEDGGSVEKGEVRRGRKASNVQCHPDCPATADHRAHLYSLTRTFRGGKDASDPVVEVIKT